MKTKLLLLSMLALAGSPPPRAAVSCWQAGPPRSTLEFSGRQAGAPAKGRFDKFAVIFCFNKTSVSGKLQVTVNTASVDTNNDTRDEILRSKNFFDTEKYPTATYTASSFTALGPNRFLAHGTLSIRGIAKSVPVDFSFQPSTGKAAAVAKGQTTINRSDFKVGQGRWSATRWVGAQVKLAFNLALARRPKP